VPGPARLPYGEGVFRRRFLLTGSEGLVVGEMEDDFHRFGLDLHHDGQKVVEIRGRASRYPWTECAGSVEPLRALQGMPLSPRSTALMEHTDPKANCTHLFDLAALAVTHACASRARRVYDITVPDRCEGRTQATLHRDGALLLDWDVKNTRILGPHPYTGVGMRGGEFLRWAESALDPEIAEAAIALRRATFIAIGRSHDLDAVPNASAYLALTGSSCHTFTPGIAEHAHRMKGTSLEFTHDPERLLADVAS